VTRPAPAEMTGNGQGWRGAAGGVTRSLSGTRRRTKKNRFRSPRKWVQKMAPPGGRLCLRDICRWGRKMAPLFGAGKLKKNDPGGKTKMAPGSGEREAPGMQKRGPGGRDVWEARETKKGQETCQSFGYWGTACMIQERVWVGRSLSKVPCLASDAQMTELVCGESEDGRFRRTREMPSVRVW